MNSDSSAKPVSAGLRAALRWGSLATAVATAIAATVAISAHTTFLDSQVYSGGADVWLRGGELYREGIPTDVVVLPFTYPPFAVVVFAGLFSVSVTSGAWLLNFLGLAALLMVCWLVARRVDAKPDRAVLAAFVACGVGVFFEPVHMTLKFGQINLVLMILVAADCLATSPRWRRGILIGIAAAIKLTPAIFVLYFAATRQWRPVRTAAASFVACTAVGWLLLPSSSFDYWFRVVLDPARVGGLSYAGNQSFRAVFARLGLDGTVGKIGWLLLVVTVLVLAWTLVSRLRAAGEDVTAWLVVAMTGVLVSPVAWSHHWVFAVPFVLALAYRAARLRTWTAWLLMAAVGWCFLLGPHWLFSATDDREKQWELWQHILGGSYVLIAVATLVVVLVRHPRAAAALPRPPPTTLIGADR